MLHIPAVLTADELAQCRRELAGAGWADGRHTAGVQSATAKDNRQLPSDSPVGRVLGELVMRALGRNAAFNSAAVPRRVVPPLFNRYDVGMSFGAHVDNAVRPVPGTHGLRIRTDLSATLFLTDPADYDGGELCLHEASGTQEVRLPAGDMLLYDTTVLHSVNEVTRGSRWASVLWVQSMVRESDRRAILLDLDRAIMDLRARLGEHDAAVLGLVNGYHNLMRQWCEV